MKYCVFYRAVDAAKNEHLHIGLTPPERRILGAWLQNLLKHMGRSRSRSPPKGNELWLF